MELRCEAEMGEGLGVENVVVESLGAEDAIVGLYLVLGREAEMLEAIGGAVIVDLDLGSATPCRDTRSCW